VAFYLLKKLCDLKNLTFFLIFLLFFGTLYNYALKKITMSTTKQQIFEEAKSLLIEQLGISSFKDSDSITLNTHLKREFNVDSVDMCFILVGLEDKFGFSFSIDDETKISEKTTMGCIVDVTYNRINCK